MKILIADDEPLSRRLLEKTLERAGYEVISVANGKQALEALSRPDAPRLALLDWVMPELDGLAVCRAVRRRSEQAYAYLVLLTSKGTKEETVRGLESGARVVVPTVPMRAAMLASHYIPNTVKLPTIAHLMRRR